MNIDPRLIAQVKGFLAEEEGRALWEFALCASQSGPCLEIGSYCGKSSLYLGDACRQNRSILFSIDHHCGSEEQQPGEVYFDPELFNPALYRVDTLGLFRRTIEKAGLQETVVPIVCHSHVAARYWSTPLSLVFIDGGHAYETVYTDYLAWSSHIQPGGYLLIHDIFKNPQEGGQAPYRIFQMALASGLFCQLDMVRSLGVLKRLRGGETGCKVVLNPAV
jgi:predicted O-methyltransferase YrrM